MMRLEDSSLLGCMTNWPSGVSIFVWFRVISRTVPTVSATSMSSPMLKGWDVRITRPPATLPRMSSAARVTPSVSTDTSAVRDEVFNPKASAVMMPVSR